MQRPTTIADRIEALMWALPEAIQVGRGLAERVEPPGGLEGAVIYLDPPYQGRTGYPADLSRPQLLDVARRWSDAGAVVAVSEAVPLDDDLGAGWEALDLLPGASAKQREVLTINQPARAKVAVQVPLCFAEACVR